MSIAHQEEDSRSTLPCETNPDLWFAELRRHKRSARRGCQACPLKVKQACLEHVLEIEAAGHQQWGIWAGLDLDERKALLEARNRAPEVQAA